MSNRQKMYYTNSHIKKALVSYGFKHLYLFPHLRFIKDYYIEECGFDAIGWKEGEKELWLFQFKTGVNPLKSEIERYKALEVKYACKCAWITRKNAKITMFTTQNTLNLTV